MTKKEMLVALFMAAAFVTFLYWTDNYCAVGYGLIFSIVPALIAQRLLKRAR